MRKPVSQPRATTFTNDSKVASAGLVAVALI